MSRNSSGTYTLPAGNPVVSGTIIEASWANVTLSDLAAALTDSLSRSGQGGMSAALRIIDGTAAVPGVAFGNETGSGAYRAAAGDWYLTVLGSGIARIRSTGVDITGALGVSGTITGNVTGNISGNAGTVTNGVYTTGDQTIGGTKTFSANPTLSAGTANGVPYLNGSKSLVSGSGLTFDGSKFGINKTSPYSTLDVGGNTAQVVTSLFTTGVDDLNFRVGAANGVAGSTGSLQGQIGLFYLGTGDAATIGFVRGGSATDASLTFRTNAAERMRITDTGLVGIGGTPTVSLDVGFKTDAIRMPVGTTAQRPTGASGLFRMNSTTGAPEWYDSLSSTWVSFYDRPQYSVDYLVVAGGGGGGGANGGNSSPGAGGGAGGLLTGSGLTVSKGTQYTITIGAGGAGGGPGASRGTSGANTVFASYTAVGGGGGGPGSGLGYYDGLSGGSGGGGGVYGVGGAGTSGQGYAGGTGSTLPMCGGGGGAGGVGYNGGSASGTNGQGGIGVNWLSLGTYYAGGGGSGTEDAAFSAAGGNGGGGAGGAGSPISNGTAGTANRGGGGGGGGADNSSTTTAGGSGGSGVVIIRYAGAQRGTGGTVTSSGGYTYHTFTTSGIFTA
jgi:hypothetical protein